jgi:hypothetical protein
VSAHMVVILCTHGITRIQTWIWFFAHVELNICIRGFPGLHTCAHVDLHFCTIRITRVCRCGFTIFHKSIYIYALVELYMCALVHLRFRTRGINMCAHVEFQFCTCGLTRICTQYLYFRTCEFNCCKRGYTNVYTWNYIIAQVVLHICAQVVYIFLIYIYIYIYIFLYM